MGSEKPRTCPRSCKDDGDHTGRQVCTPAQYALIFLKHNASTSRPSLSASSEANISCALRSNSGGLSAASTTCQIRHIENMAHQLGGSMRKASGGPE